MVFASDHPLLTAVPCPALATELSIQPMAGLPCPALPMSPCPAHARSQTAHELMLAHAAAVAGE